MGTIPLTSNRFMNANDSRYDRTTIVLHWITAVAVVLLWASGQTVDWLPSGAPRIVYRSLHILVGACLALVVVRRIAWRAGSGRRLPPAYAGALGTLARTGHLALYALLVVTLLLGLFNTWVRGDNLFNLLVIPAFDPGNKVLRREIASLHEWAANTLFIVAGLHAAIALIHHRLGHPLLARITGRA
jgi:cytochrome b561